MDLDRHDKLMDAFNEARRERDTYARACAGFVLAGDAEKARAAAKVYQEHEARVRRLLDALHELDNG